MSAQLSNLGDCLAEGPEPDRTALIDLADNGEPRRYSFADLHAQANALARALLRHDVKRGDAVAILSANRAEFVTTYFGAMRAGVVPVPINFRLPKQTIEHIISDCSAKIVFCDSDQRSRCPGTRWMMEFERPGDGGFRSFLDYGDFESITPKANDLALILYTSGSQGAPKGVTLTHAGMVWAAQMRTAGTRARMRGLVVAPLYHMNGLTNITLQLLTKSETVMMRRFEARRYLETAARYRCGALGAIPAMMAMAAREEDLVRSLDLSCVEQVVLGSAPCTTGLIAKVKAMFPRARVSVGYGATETGPCVFGPHPAGRPLPVLSIGHPYPSVEVRLGGGDAVNEGEIYVRSPAVSPGYLNRPTETKERFHDGWYATGDIMRRDEDGFYYFIARADDMFVCGGENVYPGDVEAILERNLKVHQAAVVPLPDEIKGQVPVAFIVPKRGVELTEQEVKAFALEHGPAYQHPRRVALVDQLPLAGPEKIDRRDLIKKAKDLWLR